MSQVNHKEQFFKNMQTGIPLNQRINYFAPKITRPLSQSTLITGGPPRMITGKNLEKYVKWLDNQDLKVMQLLIIHDIFRN